MHANRLADIAAMLAFHAPVVLRGPQPAKPGPLHDYWMGARRRSEWWHGMLHEGARLDRNDDSNGLRAWWLAADAVIQEVFVSEILVRSFAALGTAWDGSEARNEIAPVARSVYISHLDARSRAMRLMLSGRGIPLDISVRLNRLRGLCERWSDLLVGQIVPLCFDAIEFAVDQARCKEFACDAAETTRHLRSETVGWLLSLSLRDSLGSSADAVPACPQENQQVADAVLAMFASDAFDSTGKFKSLQRHRIEHKLERTEASIDALLYGESVDEQFAADDEEEIRVVHFKKRV